MLQAGTTEAATVTDPLMKHLEESEEAIASFPD